MIICVQETANFLIIMNILINVHSGVPYNMINDGTVLQMLKPWSLYMMWLQSILAS